MEKQASYWEARIAGFPDADKRLACYQLRVALTGIYASTLDADWDNLKWVTRRSREILTDIKRS